MKVIVTGSLGHISKPLTAELIGQGHQVTVVTSQPDRRKDIEILGAVAAVGTLEDKEFLAATFIGADAVYAMIPPNNYFDHDLDLPAYYRRIAANYAQAIRESDVRRVIYLSSIGAHLAADSGIIIGHHDGEAIINELPDVAVTFMRPTAFYYNLYGYAEMIKSQNLIAVNYGSENVIPWVSPNDIAAAIAEELTMTPPSGSRKVRYVASEELTGDETAGILGAAMNKPNLRWTLVSDEQMLDGLNAAGMNPRIAAGLVEMYAALRTGLLSENYHRNKPAVLGKVKLADFAKEFAAVTQ